MTRATKAGFTAPEILTDAHALGAFSSGDEELDVWLRTRALRNQTTGASRTYVLCANTEIVAYYALAVGSVMQITAPGRIRRNMPDPIPVMILARLAVGKRWQGQGLGKALVRDAVLRTLQAADIAGIRALLVHAISAEAKRFYEKLGFQPSPLDPMTLMATLKDAGPHQRPA